MTKEEAALRLERFAKAYIEWKRREIAAEYERSHFTGKSRRPRRRHRKYRRSPETGKDRDP